MHRDKKRKEKENNTQKPSKAKESYTAHHRQISHQRDPTPDGHFLTFPFVFRANDICDLKYIKPFAIYNNELLCCWLFAANS